MMTEHALKDVTIVCVTYLSRDLADPLCDMLRPFPNIILVDNASTDGTAASLRERLPHATVIENTHNEGYGRACNLALAGVCTPLTLLINPDCVISPDSLATLMATLQRYPSTGLVAPQSLDRDLSPRKSYRPAFHLRMNKARYRVPDATCSAQWVHGCCLLLRTHAFHRIGGFDERFFLFFEDDDLCLRMQNAGFDCLLEPAATILHTGGASSTPTLRNRFLRCYHYVRSKHLITQKYLGREPARSYLAKILLACLPAMLFYSLLLKRRHFVKWLAWGTAALACTLHQTALTGDFDATRTPGPIPH